MTESVTVYGIANCDTIRKALRWLETEGIDYRFHDYRKQGLDAALLQQLVDGLGWETMLNRRGTTWRNLPETVRNHIDKDIAGREMLANPALIKRPILTLNGTLYIGFNAQQYAEIFDLS